MTQSEGTCPNCGAPVPVEATACERCSASLVSASSAATIPVSGPFFGSPDEKNMETVRVDAPEVPPEYLSSSPAPALVPVAPPSVEEAPPPPFEPLTPPPPDKPRKSWMIIAVVAVVLVCLCVCACIALGVWGGIPWISNQY
jgi:hypothetical protein